MSKRIEYKSPEDSKRLRLKLDYEIREGKASRDGQPFLDEEVQLMFELFLSGVPEQRIATYLRRPYETVHNKLWKVARRYKPSINSDVNASYTIQIRNRSRVPWNKADVSIVKWWRKWDGEDYVWLSRLLGRTVSFLKNKLRRKAGFFE